MSLALMWMLHSSLLAAVLLGELVDRQQHLDVNDLIEVTGDGRVFR